MKNNLNRAWVNKAISIIEADLNRSSDTHLIKLDIPSLKDVDIYLKDESTHATGSLKHRLARSLFLYGICNGHINEDTTIIEASSGSTAISEAYFAKLLNLKFIAVISEGTAKEKIEEIKFYGAEVKLVVPKTIYKEAKDLADSLNGYYMDQFTYAERATDWRGNNNIAQSIFEQMSKERYPIPKWVVTGAGTGGTCATIGRYIRYKGFDTNLCVCDPENSVFYDYYNTLDKNLQIEKPSNIGGIGRPRVEPSFLPEIIDHMLKIEDGASIATVHFLEKILNRKCGGSTGTNIYALFKIVSDLNKRKDLKGSFVTLLCDGGDRYLKSYYSDDWIKSKDLRLDFYTKKLENFYKNGILE